MSLPHTEVKSMFKKLYDQLQISRILTRITHMSTYLYTRIRINLSNSCRCTHHHSILYM